MNEEIDESEFYHQDFTTASEWEIFVARMEEIMQEWKIEESKELDTDETDQSIWLKKTENIPFADVEFTLTLYKYKQDLRSEEFEEKNKNPIDSLYDFNLDYPESSLEHPLAYWYGLSKFIVLSPIGNTTITSESQIKILLSSAHIVTSNLNNDIPIFVQIREKWQQCYLGVFEGNGVRTNFEMIHLRRGPQHCQYLTGLLDLFKTKIMSPVSLDPISVSVLLTYNLSDFGTAVWKQDVLESEHDSFDYSNLCRLPFGVTVDPISTLVLKATWSCLPDHLIVDSESYSDFDPMQAPKWSVLSKMIEQPVCLLGECLSEFSQIINNTMTIYDILGDFAVNPSDTVNPLDVLTEPKVPTISSVLKRAARNSLTRTRKGVAPLSEDVLVPMLYFLFPDAEEEPLCPYSDKPKQSETSGDESHIDLDALCRGFKTCGSDSLVWRLSIVLAQALHSLGGNRAFAHIWFEFIQEMRYRWEKGISIPGLAAGFPDPRTCLLHQKLQMLNCCIERKKAREASLTSSAFESAEDSSTDDEEFFDCSADKQEDDSSAKRKEKHSLWNQPVGRLGKFGNLKLLKTGDPLYIPTTQDPVPKTEDQLEEDTNVLLKLGSDAQGSELRAKMMSASLLSDMESFKAANPGSILEDFIRWYSPRDWIEDEGFDEWGQKKGHLSSRMLISDNTWVQMWESAKPVAANRQKRLFDDTREAEKVLHFLDSRTVGQIAELLLPVLSHAALSRIADECEQVYSELKEVASTVRHLVKSVERLSREGKISPRRFEVFTQEMTSLELQISQVNSLLYKFNPSGGVDDNSSALVAKLVAGYEVEIEGKMNCQAGNRIMTMFSDAQKAANMILSEQGALDNPTGNAIFPQASEREFVMRVSAVRPATYSAKCPQFLRAVLSRNEFRLCGAFSEDIVFF